MAREQYEISRYAGGDFGLYDYETGKDVAIVRGTGDAGGERIAALFATAPQIIESLQAIVDTLEGAWREKQLTAPRFVQCQLGEEVKRAKKRLRQATAE